MRLTNRKILLGITGCIAAYKAAFLVRLLKREGAEVKVVMTRSAGQFVTRLTMETLSDNPVYDNLFPNTEFYATHHIDLAAWADLIIIAPASGNIIGKIASGIADDLLATIVMAAQSPVMLAATMNTHMYENPIVQDNMDKMKDLGYRFIEPSEGELACHTYGVGRMSEPEQILKEIIGFFFDETDLDGLNVLVTAGPTVEYIDAVRFISNPSSGKMGYALAHKAAIRGADVVLVSGPTNIPPPEGVSLIKVQTADEMYSAVKKHFTDMDMLFMAAAVADYKPSQRHTGKLKKSNEPMNLTLEPQIDILLELAKEKVEQVMVGFALETDDILENARAKLERKKLDMIVVNDPNEEGAAFGVDTNRVTIINKAGELIDPPLMDKLKLADLIIDQALDIYSQKK